MISLSIGSAPITERLEYLDDTIAIGSLHAVARGIMVVSSAGNNGPDGTIVNVAPWLLTVGASTIDRDYRSFLRFGQGELIKVLLYSLMIFCIIIWFPLSRID